MVRSFLCPLFLVAVDEGEDQGADGVFAALLGEFAGPEGLGIGQGQALAAEGEAGLEFAHEGFGGEAGEEAVVFHQFAGGADEAVTGYFSVIGFISGGGDGGDDAAGAKIIG